MAPNEIRNPADARRYMAQGLWLQRVRPPEAATVAAILDWALAIAAEGNALPPPGFVADVGHLIFAPARTAEAPALEAVPLRRYEDYVLGKLLADRSFDRAADALRSYHGHDRVKGLAFVLTQLCQRAGGVGVLLSPATIKSLSGTSGEEVLAEGWASLEADGPLPLLIDQYESLVVGVRALPRALGSEDIMELERRTAIASFGQRVALRQVLHAAELLEASLTPRRPPAPARQYHVPTRILEEDAYPIGGFASISTRGSIESLLHSQLAYMEREDRPDLFDIKFLRDELLYYSRDENSFLRRRRSFVIALYPDLAQARVKDASSPCQRIILLLALVQTAFRKLIDWLSAEALHFDIVLLAEKDGSPLAAERELLQVVLAEQTANGTVAITTRTPDDLRAHCVDRSRRSLCHVLLASVKDQRLEAEAAIVSRLILDAATPVLANDADTPARADGWEELLDDLLTGWI